MKYISLLFLFHIAVSNHLNACGVKNVIEDSIVLIYKRDTLQIQQLTAHTFCHVSFLQTTDFGNVACNGMIVIDNGEALIFDTPANEKASVELINWVESELKC